jgi:hypothetical protein
LPLPRKEKKWSQEEGGKEKKDTHDLTPVLFNQEVKKKNERCQLDTRGKGNEKGGETFMTFTVEINSQNAKQKEEVINLTVTNIKLYREKGHRKDKRQRQKKPYFWLWRNHLQD